MAIDTYVPRLKARYEEDVRPRLASELGINILAVPRLEKIIVNMGVGDVIREPKALEDAAADLAIITGQKPLITKAKKSIAAFKLRQGMSIGAKVTLRSNRMWEFFDRLLTLALPRIRDFRGFSPRQFDGRGNYTFGVGEHDIFPEIRYDKVSKIRGMDITIVTTATNDEGGKGLLAAFGFPFRER